MSQLLLRLEQAYASEADPVARSILAAKRACYLARVGRFSEAKAVINELRAVFYDGRSGRVTTWIMLAEGLLGLFESLSPSAFDRVFRARFLGVALGAHDVVAVASAWKAHFEFESSDFLSMVDSLRTAIANSGDEDHAAHARFSMVLCDSFFLCGDRLEAQRWFIRSRDHALKDGDQAGIEALLYNRAAFGLAWLRARRCIELLPRDSITQSRMEVNSARNLQNITGIAAFAHMIELCDARVLILEEKFELAIERLQAIRYAGPFAEYNFSQSLIDLEVAYCLHRLGRVDDSEWLANEVRAATFDGLDVDDQLVVAWIWHELIVANNKLGEESVARAKLAASISKYLDSTDTLRSLLAEFRAN